MSKIWIMKTNDNDRQNMSMKKPLIWQEESWRKKKYRGRKPKDEKHRRRARKDRQPDGMVWWRHEDNEYEDICAYEDMTMAYAGMKANMENGQWRKEKPRYAMEKKKIYVSTMNESDWKKAEATAWRQTKLNERKMRAEDEKRNSYDSETSELWNWRSAPCWAEWRRKKRPLSLAQSEAGNEEEWKTHCNRRREKKASGRRVSLKKAAMIACMQGQTGKWLRQQEQWRAAKA